jgi:hypothetical protein
MEVHDFLRGPCPYCGGRIDTDISDLQYGAMPTKICAYPKDTTTCFRDLYPGMTLPIIQGPNYYGDTLPDTFLWIVSGHTICCRQKVATLINVSIISTIIRTQDIDFDNLGVDVYDEDSRTNIKRMNNCIAELKDNAFNKEFSNLNF